MGRTGPRTRRNGGARSGEATAEERTSEAQHTGPATLDSRGSCRHALPVWDRRTTIRREVRLNVSNSDRDPATRPGHRDGAREPDSHRAPKGVVCECLLRVACSSDHRRSRAVDTSFKATERRLWKRLTMPRVFLTIGINYLFLHDVLLAKKPFHKMLAPRMAARRRGKPSERRDRKPSCGARHRLLQ